MIALDSGMQYGVNKDGARICTGARMGRRNELPAHPETREIKLSLVRLKMTADGCYDSQGAYWGSTDVYYASARFHCEIIDDWCVCRVFVHADSRDEAKAQVREFLPKARFFH